MHALDDFTLRDMTECSVALRQCGSIAKSASDVAENVVSFLYDNLIESTSGQRACALVRFFQTRELAELDADLQGRAANLLGDHETSPDLKCLTLMSTHGLKPEWNDISQSDSHRAIPLPSPEFVKEFPMIATLVKQLGFELDQVVSPEPSLLMDLARTTCNVFHVPDAVGSPYVPAQENFVVPFGIKSVLGFGGMLPAGELFSVILFSTVAIPFETAQMFKTLALSVKLALLSPLLAAPFPPRG